MCIFIIYPISLFFNCVTMVTQDEFEDAGLIGSSNAAWVPLALDGGLPEGTFNVTESVRNNSGTDFYLQYVLTMPTNRNGKYLRLARVKVMLMDADNDNYLDMIKVLGLKYNGITLHYENYGPWEDQTNIDQDISPDKSTQYDDQVIVTLHVNVTTANCIKIAGVMLKVYYE